MLRRVASCLVGGGLLLTGIAQNASKFRVDSDGQVQSIEIAHQPPSDTDGDGLADTFEAFLGTDPFNPDSDGDGTSDLLERRNGTDPLDPGSGAAPSKPPTAPGGLTIYERTDTNLTLIWAPSAPDASRGRTILRYEVWRNGGKLQETTGPTTQLTVPYSPDGFVWEYLSVRAMDDQGTPSAFSAEVVAPRNENVPSEVDPQVEAKYAVAGAAKSGFLGMVGKAKLYRTAAWRSTERSLGSFDKVPVDWGQDLSIDASYQLADGTWKLDVSGTSFDRVSGVSGTWVSGIPFGIFGAVLQSPGGQRLGALVLKPENPRAAFSLDTPEFTETDAMVSLDTIVTSSIWGDSFHLTRHKSLALSDEFTDGALQEQVTNLFATANGRLASLDWFEIASASFEGLFVGGILDFPPYLAQRSEIVSSGVVTFLTMRGAIYRLRTPGDRARQVRWAEVFQPADDGLPEVLQVRSESLPAAADGTHTAEYTLAPPMRNGGVEVVPLGYGFVVGPPLGIAPDGGARLYLVDASFPGGMVELTLSTRLPADPFGSVRAVVSYPSELVRLVAVDPTLNFAEGLAQGYTVPSGSDLFNDPNRPGVGGWRLVAIAVAPGTALLEARFSSQFETFTLTKTLTILPTAQMAVDANHDGQVRLASEDASDATSAENPYRFWVNDDVDRLSVFLDSEADTLADVVESEHDDIGPEELARHNAANPTEAWRPDWEDGRIADPRDLEDFSRLHLDLGNFAARLARGDFFLGLRFKDVSSGDPRIQLYPAADSGGGLGYLSDPGAGALQTFAPGFEFGQAVVDRSAERIVTQERTFVFQLDRWQGGRIRVPFLFEAAAAGRGRLTLVLVAADGVTELGEIASVHLDLRRIGDLYEHWSVGQGPDPLGGGEPDPIAARIPSLTGSPTAFHYDQDGPGPEERKYILFVHGWNMERWEKERYAETAYKRLWWQGYQGRFGLFSWPTTNGFGGGSSGILGTLKTIDGAVNDGTNFDRGEWTAWRSATPLRQLMQELSAAHAGELYVLSHSMGGSVVSEALRLQSAAGGGPIAKVYVASQAAFSAHTYDGTLAEAAGSPNALQWDYDHPKVPGGTLHYGPDTANIYRGWFAFLLTGGGGGTPAVGSIVNFYNQNDWALSAPAWQFNQIVKPDFPDGDTQPFIYDYDPLLDRFGRLTAANVRTPLALGTPAQPADRYEIMAFAAESRVKAFGATPNVSQGISGAVDLRSIAIWPADADRHTAHKWHSAQFRSTIQQQRNYWKALLSRDVFNIPTVALP